MSNGNWAWMWDGLIGRVMAKAMRVGNVDIERAAIDELAPGPSDDVLEIGFGPGAGIKMLAARLEEGSVAGVDPSRVMMGEAAGRNRKAIESGHARLCRASAHELPFEDRAFDGVIAANSVQLWLPFEESVAEVRRVLRPGGLLVTLTHRWAIKMLAPPDEWLETTRATFARNGLGEWRTWTGKALSGTTVGVAARRVE